MGRLYGTDAGGAAGGAAMIERGQPIEISTLHSKKRIRDTISTHANKKARFR